MSTEKVPDDAELAEPEEAQDEPDVTVMKKPSGKAKAKAKAVKAKAAPKKGLVKCKDEPKDDEKEEDDDDQPMKKPASKAPMKKPATPKGGGKAAQKAAALKKAAAEAKKAEEKKKKEEKKRKREEEIARDWKSGLQADDDHQEGERGEEEELDDDPCMATFTKNKSTEKEKSLPKSLFMGKFNLNEETFARGLMDNDFRQVKKSDGRIEYAWGQSEHSTTRGKQSKTTLQTQAQGSRQDIAKFSKTAKSWKIGLFAQSDDPDGD
ncbi:unnamed protein product, partial [Symbiodinium necroappetens]